MALSVDQLYLLNCLSYMCPSDVIAIQEGEKIGDYCQRILDSSSLTRDLSDGEFRSREEVIKTCQRIVNDPDLSAMNIVATQRTVSHAYGFVAVTEGNGEAVVCFQGSVGDTDWVDNAVGGAGLSTPEQRGAMEWYKSSEVQKYIKQCDTVTISGHSKGGNKAKYITLMEEGNQVDRCVSFDGQGFSDEFMNEYQDQILANQDKIINYSNEKDYVNILLNDVGERYYVKADSGVKNYATHHSLFSLSDTESFEENLTQQNPVMASLDKMLNSYLRTLSPSEKAYALQLIGNLLACAFDGGGDQFQYQVTDFLKLKNLAILKGLLAHLTSFYIVDPIVGSLMDWLRETFPFLSGLISAAEWAAEHRLGLDMHVPDGDDIRYEYVSASGGSDRILVDTDTLDSLMRQLRNLSNELADYAQQLRSLASGCMESIAQHKINLGLGSLLIRGISVAVDGTTAIMLRKMASSSEQISERCNELAGAVKNVSTRFEETETRVVELLQ